MVPSQGHSEVPPLFQQTLCPLLYFLFVLVADHPLAVSPQSDWLVQVDSQQQGSLHLYLIE
ncbi:hypothetical protein L798_12651 [Zootermopsis nevadensis]|uniref:Uncharacterized protein n=1 Tax=Zootermopsis nevadensis TaxID=136037 RepID=A0A067R2N0_ZOONE|nr:hypothetical protein L798_12651 [Zootermopsis nevadensis]